MSNKLSIMCHRYDRLHNNYNSYSVYRNYSTISGQEYCNSTYIFSNTTNVMLVYFSIATIHRALLLNWILHDSISMRP